MSEFRRRLMIQQESDPNVIPAGCVRCEYLESTGTQWIDTEYYPEIGDEIFITNVQAFIKGTNLALFSSGVGNYQTILLTTPNLTAYFYKYFATGTAVELSCYANNLHNIRIANDGRIYINDVEKGKSNPVSQTDTPLFLLKRANNAYYWKGTIGEFIITKNGNDILHLIPILDKNGVACMYDTVRKKYHYNKGTGEFLYKILEQ